MTQATFDRKLAQLKRTEERARDLQEKLDAIERQWNQRITELRGNSMLEKRVPKQTRQMWESHCEAKGIAQYYDFGDMIC